MAATRIYDDLECQDATDRRRAAAAELRGSGEDVHQAAQADTHQARQVQEHEDVDRHEVRPLPVQDLQRR